MTEVNTGKDAWSFRMRLLPTEPSIHDEGRIGEEAGKRQVTIDSGTRAAD
ncbi:MAG: hypothetical protein WA324_27435 [Bryobacteraceae bacterium]